MKVLYNVTVKVEAEICSDWLEWMKNIHIPEVMATACFESYKMTRILGDDDDHGIGFAIQYIASNMEMFQKYNQSFAPKLQKAHADRYHQKYVAFRTLMMIEAEG